MVCSSMYMLNPASSGAPSTAARLLLPISLGILRTVCSSSRRESKMSRNPGRSNGLGFLYVEDHQIILKATIFVILTV